MNLKDALKRIEELEHRVKELEAQPKQVFEYHYHQPPYVPQPVYPGYYPNPLWPTVTYGGVGLNAISAGH